MKSAEKRNSSCNGWKLQLGKVVRKDGFASSTECVCLRARVCCWKSRSRGELRASCMKTGQPLQKMHFLQKLLLQLVHMCTEGTLRSVLC